MSTLSSLLSFWLAWLLWNSPSVPSLCARLLVLSPIFFSKADCPAASSASLS
jgi:hypothetical protein